MKTALTPERIFEEMISFGVQHADPVLVAKYSRYFKEGYEAFGLKEGLLDEKVESLLSDPGMSYPLILKASLLLVGSPKYEVPSCAIKLVLAKKKEWDRSLFVTMEEWFARGINNWAHTDYICGEITPLLISKGIISLKDLEPWRFSPFRFQRRASAVTLIKPMKKESDFSPFYDFIEPMMHDTERVVHQGLGWLLREMWKKQPVPTEAFLLRFRETAPRLIFQYATEKMTPENRERFRKTRPGK